MKRLVVLAACLLLLTSAAFAKKKAKTESGSVTIKTTIDAIDHDARTVTFKDKDGNYETLHAGPEVKRFDELKVGDKVTFKYTASVAVRVRKPGEPAVASGSTAPAVVRGTGPKPSGSITQQETATVVVKAVDPKLKSLTVTTDDGRTMSFKVEDKGLVKGVKPGDKIEVTYTDGLMVSVE